jgi:hypothetical protein
MNPQPLSITQPIILRLDFSKHHRPRLIIPKEQIRDASAALLILLCHDLADGSKSFAAETLHDLNQVLQIKGPVKTNSAGLRFAFPRMYLTDNTLCVTIRNLNQSMIDFRCTRRIENIRV